jgi:uncharacterized protein YukE
MADFADTTNPIGRLNPPGNYDQQVLDATRDALGAIKYIDELFQEFVGWSPAQELMDAIGGNWGQLLSLRDVWNNISFASGDVEANLDSGRQQLDPHWDGNAAAAFNEYMGQWSLALSQNRDACAAVRDKLVDLAENAKQAIDQIIQAIKTIVSLLSAASASIEIPVWGEYKILKAIWEGVKTINEIRKVVSALVNTVKLAVEFFQSIAEIVDDKTPTVRVDVPSVAYGGPKAPGN